MADFSKGNHHKGEDWETAQFEAMEPAQMQKGEIEAPVVKRPRSNRPTKKSAKFYSAALRAK